MNIPVQAQSFEIRQPLSGKLALITGSTSGIGLGIARALANAGSHIVLNGFATPDQVAAARRRRLDSTLSLAPCFKS
jgi:3-hydroxybutyrate dehydrogenase